MFFYGVYTDGEVKYEFGKQRSVWCVRLRVKWHSDILKFCDHVEKAG